MHIIQFLLLFALPSWIVTSLLPLVLPLIAGTVTTALHTYFMKAVSWYSRDRKSTRLNSSH